MQEPAQRPEWRNGGAVKEEEEDWEQEGAGGLLELAAKVGGCWRGRVGAEH